MEGRARLAGRLLKERDGVIADVSAVLDAARAGEGRVLLLEGAPGLGKTTLLTVTAELARGFRIGRARGGSGEALIPYGVFNQLAAELDAPASLGSGDPTEAVDSATARARRFYATVQWLREAASAPLLLLIDDLHWADGDSLALLGFVCRRLGGLPLAVVASARTFPRGAIDLMEALEHDGHARISHLRPLTHAASAAMLAVLAGEEAPPAEARSAWELCNGNPLLLEQVALGWRRGVAAPARAGWADADGLLLERFAGVPEPALELARGAAVLGTRFRLDVALAMTDAPEREARATLTMLCQAGLVRDGPAGTAEFTHPLFRQALYGAIPPPVRTQLHRLAFRLLVEHAGDPAEPAEHAVLGHLHGDLMAVAALERAGRAAMRAGAVDTARRHLSAAVELAGTAASAGLLLTLAEVLFDGGRLREGSDLCRRVAGRPDLSLTEAVDAVWFLGRAAFQSGRAGEAALHLEAAAARAAALSPGRAARILLDAAVAVRFADGPAAAVPWALRARDLAGKAGGTIEHHATAVWGDAAVMSGDVAGLAALEVPVLEGPTRSRRRPGLLADLASRISYVNLAKITERFDDAILAFETGYAAALRTNSPAAMVLLSVTHADTLLRLGRLREGAAHLDIAAEWMELAGPVGTSATIGRALLALESGDPVGSAACCDAAAATLERSAMALPVFHMWVHRIRADLALGAGDVDGALREVAELRRLAGAYGVHEPCVVPWRGVAIRACLAAGRLDEVSEHAAQLHVRARRLPCRWPRITAELGRAGLAELAGDADAAESHHLRALRWQQDSPLRLSEAETLLAYGAFLRRCGRQRRARALLSTAAELTESIGAGRLQALIADELRTVDGRRTHRGAALTVQETRVADLASTGLTNRQIAARLTLSMKTVDHHLQSVYSKLHIHSRRQLMVGAGRARPLPSTVAPA